MWKLGTVPYLNAVPLLEGLAERADLVAAAPSDLGPLLARGDLDAALLPVAEEIRGVGAGFLGRHGIASEGPVRSVLAFLRAPVAEVRSVLLDPASRSSAALLRWLLREAGARPATWVTAAAPGPDPASAREDAVLLIGDPALRAAESWKGARLDLGEEWTRRTRLPFVYARWTARRGLAPAERDALAALLDDAADRGLPRRAEVARRFAVARGEDPERAVEYVRRFVRYRIGPREEEAIARFAEILREAEPVAAKEPHA
jgi:predicted solute-binding protein